MSRQRRPLLSKRIELTYAVQRQVELRRTQCRSNQFQTVDIATVKFRVPLYLAYTRSSICYHPKIHIVFDTLLTIRSLSREVAPPPQSRTPNHTPSHANMHKQLSKHSSQSCNQFSSLPILSVWISSRVLPGAGSKILDGIQSATRSPLLPC